MNTKTKFKQLAAIASKPKLVSVVLDDEETIKEYGEPMEFFTYDRQPLAVFMELASIDQTDRKLMLQLVMPMILDEEGNKILTGEITLTTKTLITAVHKIVDLLGN